MQVFHSFYSSCWWPGTRRCQGISNSCNNPFGLSNSWAITGHVSWRPLLGLLSWQPSNLANTLRQRQDGRHFPDGIFKCIFLNENVLIAINISLNFVLKGPINNIPSLVQITAWRRPGNKALSEPMMVSLLMHICVTRPRWVNSLQLIWKICYP